MVTKDKKWWTFEVLGPSMIYNRFNREISCHHVTALLHHRITVSLYQSVICLAPCHQTSQSFALPPTTTSPHHRVTVLVSHLPCPLPPNQSVICLAPCHQTSQSFALPPATKPVSHLPCPLPPNQSVICLAPCHQTSQSFALPPTTASPRHCATASPRHCVSQSFPLPPATKPVSHLPCPLPPNQSVICLAPYHRVTASPRHRITASPHHRATASPRHCVSQSFALPPATKPVSHLPCPLPPNQSVICLAPCHQTSQSFALPPTTASPRHHVTASPCHHVTASPRHRVTASLPQIFPTTWVWIWLVNANQHSCDWLIVPTTANQTTGIEKPNYHKTLIFFPTTSLKWSHEARIDELADSNEPAIMV